MTAGVTVCIPAYRAESFLDRTLEGVRRQTHTDLRIVIAVDPAGDDTEAIGLRHAAEDPRIEVVTSDRRRGWVENSNAARDRVDTEFFCFCFHDDEIAPDYVATLLDRLRDHPEAASAHCTVQRFGLDDSTIPAHPYRGRAIERLLDRLLAPNPGGILRALTRTAAMEGVRFRPVPGHSLWTAYLYEMELLAAGESVAIDTALYRMWMREGSLTKTWTPDDIAETARGLAEMMRLGGAVIDATDASAEERASARHALAMVLAAFLRRQEVAANTDRLLDLASVHPALAGSGTMPGERHQRWLGRFEGEIPLLEARHHLGRGDDDAARDTLRVAIARNPAATHARWLLARTLRRLGDTAGARTEAEQVLAVVPDHAGARRLLSRLERS